MITPIKQVQLKEKCQQAALPRNHIIFHLVKNKNAWEEVQQEINNAIEKLKTATVESNLSKKQKQDMRLTLSIIRDLLRQGYNQ
jgi:hypothetical protein